MGLAISMRLVPVGPQAPWDGAVAARGDAPSRTAFRPAGSGGDLNAIIANGRRSPGAPGPPGPPGARGISCCRMTPCPAAPTASARSRRRWGAALSEDSS